MINFSFSIIFYDYSSTFPNKVISRIGIMKKKFFNLINQLWRINFKLKIIKEIKEC